MVDQVSKVIDSFETHLNKSIMQKLKETDVILGQTKHKNQVKKRIQADFETFIQKAREENTELSEKNENRPEANSDIVIYLRKESTRKRDRLETVTEMSDSEEWIYGYR